MENTQWYLERLVSPRSISLSPHNLHHSVRTMEIHEGASKLPFIGWRLQPPLRCDTIWLLAKWTVCGWHHPIWHRPTDALVENHWLSHPCRPSRNRPQLREILFRAENCWLPRVPHIWNHRALAKIHGRHPRISDANSYHVHLQLVWPCKSGCELCTTAQQ